MYDKKVIRRRRAALAVLLGLSLILLTAYFGESPSGVLHGVQRGAQQVLAPVESGASKAFKPFSDLFNWVGDAFGAKGQNKKLKKELAATRAQLAAAQSALRENQQLRAMVGLPRRPGFPQGTNPVAARVIARSPTDWYSTIYGMLLMVGQGLATLAFATVVVVWLADREPLARVVTPDRYNDLGNLLLTFVILWAYMTFAQFLIIWSGNLPEENSWYLHRSAAGWQWLIVFLALFHFALPFLLLLSHAVKRRGRRLALLAAAIVAVHLVDTYWLVAPAFHPAGLHLSWLDFAAPVGIGGVWIAAFVWLLARKPLLPLHDPRMPEVPGHE